MTILAESAEFDSEIDEAAAQARRRIRRSRYRRQGPSAGFAPWARSTSGPADERVHDDHGRAGRVYAVLFRRAHLSAVEATPGAGRRRSCVTCPRSADMAGATV